MEKIQQSKYYSLATIIGDSFKNIIGSWVVQMRRVTNAGDEINSKLNSFKGITHTQIKKEQGQKDINLKKRKKYTNNVNDERINKAIKRGMNEEEISTDEDDSYLYSDLYKW